MLNERASGILLHVTSLPSEFGIGDLGAEAYRFVDFLKNAGQRYWQILPLNPTGPEFGNSPYSSPSAFAGNTLLISPQLLHEQGYLFEKDLGKPVLKNKTAVDFPAVVALKKKLFQKAYRNFKKSDTKADYENFCASSFWLDDYAIFIAIKNHLKTKSWTQWPQDLKERQPAALEEVRAGLKESIEQEKFLQYLFYSQWKSLRQYCRQNGVKIFGDLPFYVSHESADVWANPHLFKLDKTGKAEKVAGVPPDYFSANGQLWGNPVYHWDNMQQDGFAWWVKRIKQNLQTVDVLRIDHFRAFSAYWEVPGSERTARNGKWTPSPGVALFDKIKAAFPSLPFIAEDLGEIDAPVYELRDRYALPGMRLLLYAFNSSMQENAFLPHNHVQNCVVYTGTHDNMTVKGWFQKQASTADKRYLENYVGQKVTKDNVHLVMMRLAMMSVARLAILPLQDVLGLGAEALMNRPGTAKGNWGWRVRKSHFTKSVEQKLHDSVKTYNR